MPDRFPFDYTRRKFWLIAAVLIAGALFVLWILSPVKRCVPFAIGQSMTLATCR